VVEIRDARQDEFEELGNIRVAAYLADGFLSPQSTYAPRLRALGADGLDHVLVAVQPDARQPDAVQPDVGQPDVGQPDVGQPDAGQPDVWQPGTRPTDPGTTGGCGPAASNGGRHGRVVGTVMLQGWPQGGEILAGPDEAEIRALAVSPDARGSGVGRALLAAVIERAAREGIRHLVLLTQAEMKAAHHLYEEAGFSRLPERDWSPEPGVTLLAYGLTLRSS
jgi:ribosomal protein S18 acetylase RimI-like enzyme